METTPIPTMAVTKQSEPPQRTGIEYDIVSQFNKPHEYYTMHIKAWKLPQIAGDLDKLMTSDEGTANIFKEGISEYIMTEVKEGVTSLTKFVSDASKKVMDSNISKIPALILDGVSNGFEEFINAIDGVEPNKKDFVALFKFPAPQNLTDTLRHQYDQDTYTPLESLKNMGKTLSRKIIKGEGFNRLKDSSLEFTINQAKRNNFVFDNNLINIYKQTEQREFIFNITLIPQSFSHYKQIVRAYAKLKVLMTGDKMLANMAFTQKYCFTISFENKYFKSYMMLDDTVDLNLETLEIDVSGNPYTSFAGRKTKTDHATGDGVPKLIQIIMTFRERRPLRNDEHLNKLLDFKEPTNETKTTK